MGLITQTPPTTLALSSRPTIPPRRMTANCLLPGSTTLRRYLVVFVLDVVRGARALEWLMLNKMHVKTFVDECVSTSYTKSIHLQIPLNACDKMSAHQAKEMLAKLIFENFLRLHN
jgi:hypothetical protein